MLLPESLTGGAFSFILSAVFLSPDDFLGDLLALLDLERERFDRLCRESFREFERVFFRLLVRPNRSITGSPPTVFRRSNVYFSSVEYICFVLASF